MSKVFLKEKQKYKIVTRHFLFFNWKILIPVNKPKKDLVVFVQKADDIDTVRINFGEGDPIVVKL